MVIIMILIIILMTVLYTIASDDIEVYRFYNNSNKTVCIIGSVHGDEPIGTIVLNDLLQTNYFDNVKYNCIVIPKPNIYGFKNNNRNAWTKKTGWFDINRSFEENNSINRVLKECSVESDLIVEFHEGWGFHKINPKSLGSSILPTHSEEVLASVIVDNLNHTIINPNKHFSVLKDDACAIKSSLSCYCDNRNISHILVEITGQNNIQPVGLRYNQVMTILNTILR